MEFADPHRRPRSEPLSLSDSAANRGLPVSRRRTGWIRLRRVAGSETMLARLLLTDELAPWPILTMRRGYRGARITWSGP